MLLPPLVTVAHLCGLFGLYLAAAMLVPMGIDLFEGNDDWLAFFASGSAVGAVSLLVVLATRGRLAPFSRRLGILMVNALWVTTCLAAALPFLLAEQELSLADAVFEAVSGITATGATAITGLDTLPRGFLMWRSLTHWMGGIGIIAMGLLFFPLMRGGGMQIYRMESSYEDDKPVARFTAFATNLLLIYLALTLACACAYMVAGMDLFDAVNHAMSTVATGGFSTRDASLGAFGEGVQAVAIVFMILSALPFVAYLRALVTGDPRKAFDPQVPVFLGLIAVLTLLVAPGAGAREGVHGGAALFDALFSVTSILTTTGFGGADYLGWGPLAVAAVLAATLIGGCAGSTSGGIKVFRVMVLAKAAKVGLDEMLYPNGAFRARYDGVAIPEHTVRAVLIFVGVFGVLLVALTAGLAATGLAFETAFSAALTTLTNTGPGLTEAIGPSGNFAGMSEAAKWMLSLAMLVGRLEIMTVLVLANPLFWRN